MSTEELESNAEGKRKLASIQIVKDIRPIKDADKIECLDILGWQCVSKKGEFNIGDKVIYLEVDSLLPNDKEWCAFLRDKKDPNKAIRLRTIRLRGQISQGLVVPLDALVEYGYSEYDLWDIGTDLSNIMDIKKYEPPIPACLGGDVTGKFPSYVPKTDELRVQSYPDVIDEFTGADVYVSIKVDGSSGTFIMKDGEFHVCSRNWSLKEKEGNTFWKMAHKYQIREKLERLGNYAIQGEVAGPGIQRNLLQLSDHELFIFNVYDIDKGKYLDFAEFKNFCMSNDLPMVPILSDGITFYWTMEELLELAKGNYEGTNNPREGIVIRSFSERYSKVLGGRASFKVINNDFLLGGGE